LNPKGGTKLSALIPGEAFHKFRKFRAGSGGKALKIGVLATLPARSTVKMTSIEYDFAVIWNPSHPSIGGFPTEQLRFVKTVFAGRLEQLNPCIAIVGYVADWVPSRGDRRF
jgi:hypothetical protein